MQGYSSSLGGVGVHAYEPPLSPPTPAGRPSLAEAPTPTVEAPEAAPPEPAWEADRELEPTPTEAGVRRIVVRLLGGEEVDYAEADDREIAVEAARELTRSFAEAESRGEWPEVAGRFLRPGSILSVDVLAEN